MTSGFFSLDILNITRPSTAAILFQLRYDKNAMKIISLPMLIYCLLLTPLSVQGGEVYKVFSVNRFDAYLDAKYFKTQANFGSSGEKKNLAANSSVQNLNLQTTARYLFFNDIGLYSGLNFNNIESNNGLTSRSNSLLTNVFLGGDYQFFHSEKWSIYADISYSLANEKIDLNQDAAVASEGANEFKALLVAVLNFESFRSFAKLGIDYRNKGFSALSLYGFGGEFPMGDSALGVEFAGSSTIKDDENTNAPLVRDTLTNRVNAGSRMVYAINPNLLDAQLYYSYALDPNLILKVNAGATLIGSNSADGYFVGGSINWGFGGSGQQGRRSKQSKKIINKSSLPDTEPGFKIDTTDGVDQDLFKPKK